MKKSMTSSQFAAAAVLAQMSAERTAVARAVLVDGKSYGQAVEPFGWTRQTAYIPVKSVARHWDLYVRACQAETAASEEEAAAAAAATPAG